MNKSITPWVYVFQTDCHKYQKFGRTRKHPNSRLIQVQGGCPIPLKLAFCIQTEFASQIEQDVFTEFYKQKTIGEWFSLDQNQLAKAIMLIKEKANKHG